MSHDITQPTALRWFCWYIPELAGTAIVSGLGSAFVPELAPVGILPLAAIASQEAVRLVSNARARHGRPRPQATPVTSAVAEEAEQPPAEVIDEPQAWVDEDGDAIVIGTHDVDLAAELMLGETGEPVSRPGQPCWVVIDIDDAGQRVGWRFAEAGTAHAIPACGW